MANLASTWMSLSIIVSTALWWMASASKTQLISSTPKSITIAKSLGSSKQKVRPYSGWLAMAWTSLPKALMCQSMLKLAIGYVLEQWVPILMAVKVTSMEWQQLRNLLNGQLLFPNRI